MKTASLLTVAVLGFSALAFTAPANAAGGGAGAAPTCSQPLVNGECPTDARSWR